MRERPIIFSGPMVRAILDGRKTMTRRVVKGIPDHAALIRYYGSDAPREALRHTLGWFAPEAWDLWPCNDEDRIPCPYGRPGDTLWVRETHYVEKAGNRDGSGKQIHYRATDPDFPYGQWSPSIHMPRWACRLFLTVTDVRVERLQEISEESCFAEGLQRMGSDALNEGWGTNDGESWSQHGWDEPPFVFADLWDSINSKRAPWDSNPWVWVVSFEKEK